MVVVLMGGFGDGWSDRGVPTSASGGTERRAGTNEKGRRENPAAFRSDLRSWSYVGLGGRREGCLWPKPEEASMAGAYQAVVEITTGFATSARTRVPERAASAQAKAVVNM